jgi:hypothetical protein
MATTPTGVHKTAGAPAPQGGAAAPGITADGTPTPQGGEVALVTPLAPPAHASPASTHRSRPSTGASSAGASAREAPALPQRKRKAPQPPPTAAPLTGAASGAAADAPGTGALAPPPRAAKPKIPKHQRGRGRGTSRGGYHHGGSARDQFPPGVLVQGSLADAVEEHRTVTTQRPRVRPLQPQQLGPPHYISDHPISDHTSRPLRSPPRPCHLQPVTSRWATTAM